MEEITLQRVTPEPTHIEGIHRYPAAHRFELEYEPSVLEKERLALGKRLMEQTGCALSTYIHKPERFALVLKCQYVCEQNIATIERIIQHSGANLLNGVMPVQSLELEEVV